MGKGKNKALKLKEYKVPPEKYVVVVNPWGLPDKIDMNTKLNEIGVWFELLLRKGYPNARVREIFYQKTHRNIIVELPQEVDITIYLGAYPYSKFHNNIPADDTRTAYIYEYRYTNFGNPGNKNWSGIIPTNSSIPAGLLQVLKDPFPAPAPAPAPPSDTPYAYPIPHNIQQTLAAMHLVNSVTDEKGKEKSMEASPVSMSPPASPDVGSSSLNQPPAESLFTPYEPPSHYVEHMEVSKSRINQQEQVATIHEVTKVKKMDPYEEEEVEKALLRSLSPVKKEESNEAVNSFLDSFLPDVDDEEYRPSHELLAAFADLADVTGHDEQGSAAGRLDVRVKEEPYLSKQEQLLAPSTSRMKVESDNTRYNSTMQIKPEPVDDHKLIFSSKHHHSVPRDPRRLLVPEIGNSQPSRDPRKRGAPSVLPIKHEKNLECDNNPEDADEGSPLFRKRVKMEH